jgi:hypothetical protein
MTIRNWSVTLVALMLVAPLSASALGISISGVHSTGASIFSLENNDIITFDLRLENASNLNVFGLGLGVYGYDEGAVGDASDDRLAFAGGAQGTGGASGGSIFSAIEFEGNNFGGVDDVGTGVFENGAPFPFLDPRRVQLFNGVNTVGTSADASLDIGVGGERVSSGDVHLQVSFRAQAQNTIEDVELTFGVGQFGNAAIGNGGTTLPFSNASYRVTVIPEPGTALLMGLGLAGLAANRRR